MLQSNSETDKSRSVGLRKAFQYYLLDFTAYSIILIVLFVRHKT